MFLLKESITFVGEKQGAYQKAVKIANFSCNFSLANHKVKRDYKPKYQILKS